MGGATYRECAVRMDCERNGEGSDHTYVPCSRERTEVHDHQLDPWHKVQRSAGGLHDSSRLITAIRCSEDRHQEIVPRILLACAATTNLSELD
jgi:hypothetical protein